MATADEHPLSVAAGERGKRKLLDQVREALRVRHYSIRTEEAYVHWIRRFILFHGKRHPRDMGKEDVSRFLTALAIERQVRECAAGGQPAGKFNALTGMACS